MKLKDLLILMPKNNWVSAFQNIENKKPLLNISKEEFKSIIDSAILNINNNRKGKCFDWLVLAMWINKDLAFDQIKT